MAIRASVLAFIAVLALGGPAMAGPVNGSCAATPDPVSIGAQFDVSATGLFRNSPAAITVTWHDDANNTADVIWTNAPYPEQTGPFTDANGDLQFTVPAGWTAPATANRGTVNITTWNAQGTKFKFGYCEFGIVP